MLNYNILFEIELKKIVTEEIGRIVDLLSSGISVVDYAEYKQQVGKIQGLKAALDYCDEVKTIISQR